MLAVALSTQGHFWRHGGRLPAQLFWAHTCVRGVRGRNFCYASTDHTLATCECLEYGWEWQQRSLATVERIVLPLVPLLPLASLLYLVIFLNYDGYLVRWCCCSSWLGLFSSFGLCCTLAATVRATCSVQPLGQTLVVEVLHTRYVFRGLRSMLRLWRSERCLNVTGPACRVCLPADAVGSGEQKRSTLKIWNVLYYL